jgi:antirestriction protein ArdC
MAKAKKSAVKKELVSTQSERMLASDDFFFTFNQIKELGGRIKAGAKSHMVVYYKLLKTERDNETRTFPMMRFYKVFGLSDIEGMKWKQPEVKKLDFGTTWS